MLSRLEGDNDGLVSVTSATAFGTPLAIEPVDHLRQMNWCTSFPARRVRPRVVGLYRQILANAAQYDPSGRAMPAVAGAEVVAT
jgi:hypothetical protein